MNLSEFPSSLPPGLYLTRNYQRGDTFLRTDRLKGLPRNRRWTTSPQTSVSIEWILTSAQAVTFEQWFTQSINEGVAWFSMHIMQNGAIVRKKFQFVGMYSGPNPFAKDLYKVTAELVTDDSIYTPSPFLDVSFNADFVDSVYQSFNWQTEERIGTSFADLFTFSRSTGGGRINEMGQYEWVAANVPRINYNPVTLEPEGLLVEESRTNLLNWSNDITNAEWDKVFGATATASPVPGPFGVTCTRVSLQAMSGASRSRIEQDFPSTGIAVKAGGIWIRSDVNCVVRVGWSSSGESLSNEYAITNQWKYCAAPIDSRGGAITYFVVFNPTTTACTIDAAMCQVESGAYRTSYIPTTTAQVTRAADNLSITNLAGWFRNAQNTVLIDYVRDGVLGTVDKRVVDLSSSGSNQPRFIGTTRNFTGSVSRLMPEKIGRDIRAMSWINGSGFNSAANGVGYDYLATPASSTATVINLLSSYALADRAGGTIKRIQFRPRNIINPELANLTVPT